MLSADVRFEGFTSTDWTRVLSLFQPRRAASEVRDPDRPKGGVVLVHDRGALLKLVHTHAGRLRLDDVAGSFPLSAEELARRSHASWAAIIDQDALSDIMERFGALARRGDDLTAQTIKLLEIAREELDRRRIQLWPHRLRGVPIPSAAMVDRSLDSVCPKGRAMAVGLFEEGELWTSFALHRGASGVDRILGPDEVRRDMGLLSGDFRRDYRHLARAIEERTGPLAFGCYAEVATLRRLAVDDTPGAWARAAALRDVLLHPLPAPLVIPITVDAGRAAWGAFRAIAERVDPVGVVGPAMQTLRELSAGERDVESVLGFHPLDLLRRLLSRDR